MAAQLASSASITNLDTLGPGPIANTGGQGAPAFSRIINDYVAVTTAGLGNTGTKLKVVRLKSNVKLKRLILNTDAALDTNGSPTLAFDVGAYYSDSTVDGTAVANQGAVISVNAFAAALAFGATFQNVAADAKLTAAGHNQELWNFLGLDSNPGGYIDIVVAVHTIAATAVAGNLEIRAEFAV